MTAQHELISIFITRPEQFKRYVGEVSADLFSTKYADIFNLLYDLDEYDYGTLILEYKKRYNKKLDLTEFTPTIHDTKKAILLTKEDYIKRCAVSLADKIKSRAEWDDAFKLMEWCGDFEDKMMEVINTSKSTDTLKIVRDTIKHIEESKAKRGVTGITTGMDLDTYTGGWQDGDLIIVAARPSMGKTAHVLCQAVEFIKTKHTAIFSLEMSSIQLTKRMLSVHSGIPLTKMRDQSALDWDRLQDSGSYLGEGRLHLYDDKLKIGQIIGECRKLKADNTLDVVIIDYLQLIDRSGTNANEDLSRFTRKLKLLARELEIPIIVLSQLSRAVESRQDKRPILSDLRDSGAIEQDADIVGFLYRGDYYDKTTTGSAEFIFSKHRNGSLGTVMQTFKPELTKFVDYEGVELEEIPDAF